MNDPMLMITSVIAAVLHTLGTSAPHGDTMEIGAVDTAVRDRGAVSIEQVLWYAAAAISVAVVAAIIWGQIRETASTPVQSPSAP
jgi:branched-subunit amino acid ABC-type transport system permease component